MKNQSYCSPDLEKMRADFQRDAGLFRQKGGNVSDIVFAADGRTHRPAARFRRQGAVVCGSVRAWLRKLGKTPAALLVKDWDEVEIVTSGQHKERPALYLYSQRFRTRALGDFMAAQQAEEAYGSTFPVLADFQ